MKFKKTSKMLITVCTIGVLAFSSIPAFASSVDNAPEKQGDTSSHSTGDCTIAPYDMDVAGSSLSAKTIKENIAAKMVDENGHITPMDVEVKLTELPSARMLDENGLPEKRYAIEVFSSTAKTETNTEDVNRPNEGIQATGYLRMEWTDVTGPNNTLDELSGNWDVIEGTFVKGEASYGSTHNRLVSTKTVGSSFTSSPNYTNRTLHAHYGANIKGVDKNGEKTTVKVWVCVEPSIWD